MVKTKRDGPQRSEKSSSLCFGQAFWPIHTVSFSRASCVAQPNIYSQKHTDLTRRNFSETDLVHPSFVFTVLHSTTKTSVAPPNGHGDGDGGQASSESTKRHGLGSAPMSSVQRSSAAFVLFGRSEQPVG